MEALKEFKVNIKDVGIKSIYAVDKYHAVQVAHKEFSHLHMEYAGYKVLRKRKKKKL